MSHRQPWSLSAQSKRNNYAKFKQHTVHVHVQQHLTNMINEE